VGTSGDFVGHAGGDNFIIITREESVDGICKRLKARFAEEIQTHYNFMDRQQGFILAPKAEGQTEKFPLMTLAVGTVSPSQHQFADIREITELAAEARRQDTGGASQ
jgi:GGDEF domain-containing protein